MYMYVLKLTEDVGVVLRDGARLQQRHAERKRLTKLQVRWQVVDIDVGEDVCVHALPLLTDWLRH